MFTIKFAGCGSAFCGPEYYQSNILIGKNGKWLLVDCGTHAQFSLKEALGIHNGNIHEHIEAVYISHLHADHIGGLEWMALCTKFNPACKKKIDLYCRDLLMKQLWLHSLKGGLETLEGESASLDSFFTCRPIPKHKSFEWHGIKFTPVQTIHIMNGHDFQHSYGLLIQEGDGQVVFITTDTQFAPRQLIHFYSKADIIFHDCSTAFPDPVHAYYGDLQTLSDEDRAKMWLYHYQPNPTQTPEKDGFRGFVTKGQEFVIK